MNGAHTTRNRQIPIIIISVTQNVNRIFDAQTHHTMRESKTATTATPTSAQTNIEANIKIPQAIVYTTQPPASTIQPPAITSARKHISVARRTYRIYPKELGPGAIVHRMGG